MVQDAEIPKTDRTKIKQKLNNKFVKKDSSLACFAHDFIQEVN